MALTKEKIFEFIKKKDVDQGKIVCAETNYYLKTFERNAPQTFFVSWNWSAAFFGVLWMVYRRMYLLAFLYFVLQYVTVHTIELFFPEENSRYGFGFFFFLLQGLFANSVYFSFVHHKMTKGVKHYGTDARLTLILFLLLSLYNAFIDLIPFNFFKVMGL